MALISYYLDIRSRKNHLLSLLFGASISFWSPFIGASSAVTASTAVTNKSLITKADPSPSTPSILSVSYHKNTDPHHARTERYFIEVMRLALNRSGERYQMLPVSFENQTESRAADLLTRGVFDIHWLNSSIDLEKKLLPIRIPLFKGLVGWRISAIHASKVKEFNEISTLEQLKAYKALQGNDWPDTNILRQEGFTVETAREFRSLLRMLQHGHGDFFPRSITEIWEEQELMSKSNLTIEPHLIIQYPEAFYFFVTKDNTRIKEAVEKGLNIAISDGSFDTLFLRYFKSFIQKTDLANRKIFHIKNPYIPPKTPLNRKELWFSIDDLPFHSNLK